MKNARMIAGLGVAAALAGGAYYSLAPRPPSVAGPASMSTLQPADASVAEAFESNAPPAAAPADPIAKEAVLHIRKSTTKDKFRKSYAELRQAAEEGDAESAFVLSMKIQQCGMVPRDRATLDQRIDKIQQTKSADGEGRHYLGDERAQEFIDGLNETFDYCAEVPDDQLKSANDWLKLAAKGGNVAAQSSVLMQMAMRDRDTLKSFAELDTETQALVQSVDTAAMNGSAQALMTMSGSYRRGYLVGQDPVKAYAYMSAASSIMQTAYPEMANGRGNRWTTQMGNQLAPYQQEQAEALKQQILSSPTCCDAGMPWGRGEGRGRP